jgi:hypothetical protein
MKAQVSGMGSARALACWFRRLAAATDAKQRPGFQTNLIFLPS